MSECCCSKPKLIFACSGAADVGEISDRAARKLTQEGLGKIFCLAGIGGKVSGIVANTEAASEILVIDGCPLSCARKTLEHSGFDKVKHLIVTDSGMEKGKSPATDERIDMITAKAKELLNKCESSLQDSV